MQIKMRMRMKSVCGAEDGKWKDKEKKRKCLKLDKFGIKTT